MIVVLGVVFSLAAGGPLCTLAVNQVLRQPFAAALLGSLTTSFIVISMVLKHGSPGGRIPYIIVSLIVSLPGSLIAAEWLRQGGGGDPTR